MNRFRTKTTFALTAAAASLLLVLGANSASAATIPSSWDFGTDSGKDDLSDFTVTGTSSLLSDAARLSRSSTSFGNLLALTQFTDLGNGANQNFEMEATFKPVQNLWSQDFERVGLMALAASNNSDNTGIAAVLHRGSGNAPVLLFRDGVNGSTNTSQAWTGNFGNGEVYTAKLTGTYSGTDVTLAFTLTDSDAHSQTLTETFTVASRDGQYFGFGARGNATGSGDLIVDFDNFSVVPEPASLALMGLGGLLMLSRQRKA